jgi:phosphatidylglycerophosphate synthase
MSTPSERSLPGSAAERRLGSPALPAGDRFAPVFLQVNRYINRPLASLLVGVLARTAITPNQVTLGAFFIGLGGAFAFSRGTPAFFVLGAALAQLSSVVDCADGMLARAKGQMSDFGAYLDLVLDRVNEFFLMAGAVLGFFVYSGSVRMLVLGLMTVGLYFLEVTVFYLTETHAGKSIRSQTAESRGLLIFLIFVFGAVNRIDLGTYVLFAVASIMLLYNLYAFLRPSRR